MDYDFDSSINRLERQLTELNSHLSNAINQSSTLNDETDAISMTRRAFLGLSSAYEKAKEAKDALDEIKTTHVGIKELVEKEKTKHQE